MWWQILIGVATGSILGTVIFMLGYNMGYTYGKSEVSYEKYIEAMTDDAG